VERSRGGIEVGEILDELGIELDEYYGTLNEIRMGALSTPPKPKPVPLQLYEMTKELGVPLVDGGVLDQPHIWLLMVGTIRQRESLWSSIIDNATQQKPSAPV
jgi:hypothetical protein